MIFNLGDTIMMKLTKNFLLNENVDANKIFTSDEILSGGSYILDDYSSLVGYVKYKLTDAEKAWLDEIRGKYSIADYIDSNTDNNGIVTIYVDEMSEALDDDNEGAGKAPMLSDDTALQKIFFLCYREQY